MTHDTGTIHDVLADINELSRNLTDRYKLRDGFPIFKELLQNADDADAELLRISWHPGFPKSSHSLLNGPGMLVLNDGATCHQDVLNIRRLGMNYKAGERGAIGKFGLGLKSIFHLCEAFFYVAYDPESDDSEVAREPKVFIYNPWNGGSDENRFHAEWDSIDLQNVAELRKAVAQFQPDGRFFALWVPLRQHRHSSDPIIRQFFGEKSNTRAGYLPNHLIDRIARVLPMLSRVKRVEIWNAAGSRVEAFAELGAAGERRLREIETVTEKPRYFHGEIRVISGTPDNESKVSYFGVELKLPSSNVSKIANSDFWPRTRSRTQSGESRTAKAPADAHVAAVLVATNEASVRLVIRQACYLPLATSDEDKTTRLPSHELLLHGRFFIDAGRQAIPGLDRDQLAHEPSNDEQVREAWNHRLFEQGTLPLLLKVVAKWSQALSGGDTLIEQLTRQIADDPIRKRWSGAICCDEQWLYLLKQPTEGTKSLGSWTLKTANAAVYEIPRPGDGVDLFELLPGFEKLGSNHAVTFAGWPRLTAAQATPWSATLLRRVIESLSPEVAFKTAANLSYLARFLELCATSEDQTNAVGDALWLILKKAFQANSLTLKSLEERNDDLRRVLEFVPEEHRLVLTWASSERRGAEAVFRLIAKDDCDLLPMPSSVKPERGKDCRTIESKVVVRLLRTIADQQLDNALLVDVVSDFLKRADLDRDSLWQSLKDVPLLVIYDCQQKSSTRQTWQEFEERRRQRLVFCDQAGLTQHLQAALGDAGGVWRIDPEFASKVLGEKHGLPRCSARECAAVLSTPRHGTASHFSEAGLGSWEARKALMEKLTDSLGKGTPEDQKKIKDACRLLLHGRPQDADFNPALFLATDGQSDSLAVKLVRHVLAKRQEEWRVLSGEQATWALKDGLTVTQRNQLGFYPLTLSEHAVLDLLKAHADHFSGLDVSSDEYVELLTKIDFNRNDLLRRLPIHPVVGTKQRIAIPTDNDPARVLWNDGYRLDGDLTREITLLELNKQNKAVEVRQRQLAPVLNYEQALQMALSSKHPEMHWKAIFEAIEKAEAAPPEGSDLKLKIIPELKLKKWFRTRFGAKGHDDLICLAVSAADGATNFAEDFKQEVTRLADACEGDYVPDWMLDEKLKQELNRKKELRQRLVDWKILPDEAESLSRLGALLAENENYAIGHVPLIENLFADWLAIDWDLDVMPAHRLLKAVSERFGVERCFDPASNEIRQPINDVNQVVAILVHLATLHEQAKMRDSKERVLRVFHKYLEFLLNHPQFSNRSQLAGVRLLSQAETWESPSQLCLPTEGISAKHLLDRKLLEILRPVLEQARCGTSADQRLASSNGASVPAKSVSERSIADELRLYFAKWETLLPHDVIGGFVAVLGGDPLVEKLASDYLGKRTLDRIRELLRVKPADVRDSRFDVCIQHDDAVMVTSILGDQFSASLISNPSGLLIGFGDQNVEVLERSPARRFRLRLRNVEVAPTVSPQDLVGLLCDATVTVISEAYQESRESIARFVEAAFKELHESDQLEIRVTQQLILEDAELLLSQLGLHSDAMVGPVIAKQATFRQKRAEVDQYEEKFSRSQRNTEKELRDAVREEFVSIREELRNLLEANSEGQRRVLDAVRQRIQGHNQYNPASVPFELFQNADDAAEERRQLLASNIDANSIDFFVAPNKLAVRHFGRCVNQVPQGVNPRDHKLAGDLRKMLTLGLSNKDAPSSNDASNVDDNALALTGMFGLGFKSVFLISDKPQLLSGRIGCEIVGGVFPGYLDLEQRRRFDPYLSGLTDELKREATIIELPLREDVLPKQDGSFVMSRFKEMAHLLVVFATRIREVRWIDQLDGFRITTSWCDQLIPNLTGCFKGTLQPLPGLIVDDTQLKPTTTSNVMAKRAIVFRTAHHRGALLLAHDGRRVQKLPTNVPTLWVTAPTLEALGVGFALNARFSLDPGRAQLGRESPENDRIAADLGRELGQRFVALFDHRKKVGWPRFVQDIGLDSHADEYEFWDSLWELLGPGLAKLSETSNAAQLLLRVLWDPVGGALRFYRDHVAIPTRLAGPTDERTLVALRDVNFAVDGVLAEGDGSELSFIRSWPEFEKRLGQSTLVSDKLVVGPLRKLCPTMADHIKTICLADVLDWEIPNRQVDAEAASRFGEVIHKDLKNSGNDLLARCQRGEEHELRKNLDNVLFLNRAGDYVEPNQLLIGHRPDGAINDGRHDDERNRAAFAPKNRVLSAQYTATGMAFFEVCRTKLNATSREMAGWILNATEAESRQAARCYLADGEKARELQSEIKIRGGIVGTWLEHVAQSPEFSTMSKGQQGRLLDLLPEHEAEEIIENFIYPSPEPIRLPSIAVDKVLNEIWKWWDKESGPHLRRYEQRTFPEGGLRNLNRGNNPDDELFRKDWVTLFLLGLTHTMGRTVAEQHRDFIRRCEHDGTLRMIASSEREPGAWMGWIDGFLDRQLEDSKFLQWMKQFVGVYQVSRHLEDYIAAFEAVDSEYFKSRSFGLTDITNLRSSSRFSGSDFDAPPLSRVLGMGQCFVLRELVRNEVLANSRAFRHCYVPTKRVRDLLAYELGCQKLGQQSRKWELSERIYEFLAEHLGKERSWFHGCFDLPFQIIAEDEGLQDRFFSKRVQFEDDDSDLWYPDTANNEPTAQS